jgi:hypothetical protein
MRTSVAIPTQATANTAAAIDRGRSPACHIEHHRFEAHPIMAASWLADLPPHDRGQITAARQIRAESAHCAGSML